MNKNPKKISGITSDGQIVILDEIYLNGKIDFDTESCHFLENANKISEAEQPNNRFLVESGSNQPSGLPEMSYPARYGLLVFLFASLSALYIRLFLTTINLEKKQNQPNSNNNYQPNFDLKSDFAQKLVGILTKSQQEKLSFEETRLLLVKDCGLSEDTINELLRKI